MELSLNGITKSYTKGRKRKNALENFTLTLSEGVYGILGPNGAGKSTLINIITGIIAKDSGTIAFSADGSPYLENLGFMPQSMDFYRNFTAKEYIKYIMLLKRFRTENDDDYAVELLDRVNLKDDANKKIGAFSGGMKQRLGIAQAIVGKPKVLIFDEPTAGLDARERIRFRNLISALGSDKIVILATHIVTDIAFIAKTVVLMDKGKIIDVGTQEELCAGVKDNVRQCEVESSEVMDYMSRYQVSNAVSTGEKYLLRIVGSEFPENSVSVEPTLEDVCVWKFGDSSVDSVFS